MRFSISILLLLLLVTSCQDVQRMEKPDDLIGEEKMVDVLTELSLLRAARNYNKKMLEKTGIDPEEYLWQKYDIDSMQFVTSSNFYAENYDQYEVIYDSVKARLETYKETYDSIKRLEKEERDTLKRLEPENTLISRDSLFAEDSIRQVDTLIPRKIQVPMKGTEVLPDTSGVTQFKRAGSREAVID